MVGDTNFTEVEARIFGHAMKERLPLTEWPDNLQDMIQTGGGGGGGGGHPMSIYQKDELKQEKLLNNSSELTFQPSPHDIGSLDPMEMSLPTFTNLQTERSPVPLCKSSPSPTLYDSSPVSLTLPASNAQAVAMIPIKKVSLAKRRSEDIEKQKYDKKTNDVKCICCSVNGTCVGSVGVFFLIGMAIALLSVPGPGRMPETVPMYISNMDQFMNNYNNDSYGYSFRILKHIRSYMRYTFLRKENIARSFVSISFQLGWIDDHLNRDHGITQLLFDQLPYESFFMRIPENSHFFRIIHRCDGTYTSKVDSSTSQIDISIPNHCLEDLMRMFCKYYGFGHSHVPLDIKSFLRDRIQTPENFEKFMILLPSQEEFFPKLVLYQFI